MEGAEFELERRSKFLSGLIEKKKAKEQQEQHTRLNVRVRAADMPSALQTRAFTCAREQLDSMPGKLDSKRLALALKKVTKKGELKLRDYIVNNRPYLSGFSCVLLMWSTLDARVLLMAWHNETATGIRFCIWSGLALHCGN